MKAYLIIIFILIQALAFGQPREVILDSASIAQMSNVVQGLDQILTTTTTYNFSYLSDGLNIDGYYSTPKAPGKYPIVIFNRGGNTDFAEINDERAIYFLSRFATWGYIAIASNLRGSSKSEGNDEFGGKEINDIFNLLSVIDTIQQADSSRIGLYGWSRGGMMTYQMLAKSCRFKAAVIGAGLTNSLRGIEERPRMEEVYSALVPDYENNREQAHFDRSAIYWAEQLCKTTPILLLHGSGDWRVSPLDALEMADRLYENKHPFRLAFYEGGDHGLRQFRPEFNFEVKAFLDRYVRDEKKWSSLDIEIKD